MKGPEGHVNGLRRHMNEPRRHMNGPRRHMNGPRRHMNGPRRHVNEPRRHPDLTRRHLRVPPGHLILPRRDMHVPRQTRARTSSSRGFCCALGTARCHGHIRELTTTGMTLQACRLMPMTLLLSPKGGFVLGVRPPPRPHPAFDHSLALAVVLALEGLSSMRAAWSCRFSAGDLFGRGAQASRLHPTGVSPGGTVYAEPRTRRGEDALP